MVSGAKTLQFMRWMLYENLFFLLYLCKRYLYVGEKCTLDDLFRLEMFILEIVCNPFFFFVNDKCREYYLFVTILI